VTAPVEVLPAEPLAVYVEQERAAVSPLMQEVEALQVVDAASMERAADYTAEAKRRIKVIEEKFAGPKKSAHAAWKGIVALETEALALYQLVVAKLTPKQTRYLDEQRRLAEEAARIANEKAEKERLRLAAQAEADRQAATAAAEAGDTKTAEKLEARADAKEARAEVVPVYVPPPVVAPAGMSAARPWKAACIDLEALLLAAVTDPDANVQAIARGMLKIEFSVQAGNRQAAQTKNLIRVPGVVFAQETSLRQSGR
jgi:hypothetical protein